MSSPEILREIEGQLRTRGLDATQVAVSYKHLPMPTTYLV